MREGERLYGIDIMFCTVTVLGFIIVLDLDGLDRVPLCWRGHGCSGKDKSEEVKPIGGFGLG